MSEKFMPFYPIMFRWRGRNRLIDSLWLSRRREWFYQHGELGVRYHQVTRTEAATIIERLFFSGRRFRASPLVELSHRAGFL